MPGHYVHLCIGKAPLSEQGTIIIESTPSHNLCDYTVWHTYEHCAMFQYGAHNKAKLCALWEYAPFRTKVAALLGRPIEARGGGRSAILDAMGRMSAHEWRAALFEGTYYDVYVMASYHGGCDLYMRSPTDRPMQAWWHYKARKMAADPILWWTMPPERAAVRFYRVASRMD